MYKQIIRPILFLFNPETIHHLIIFKLKLLFKIPGVYSLISFIFHTRTKPVELFGIQFPNKVGLAAGFDKNAELVHELSAFGFGHIEIGTITPKPQTGNPKPRLFRLVKDNALINRMGFNNVGVDQAIIHLKKLKKKNVIIGGNIGKNTSTPNDKAVDDYLLCFEKLYDYVDYFVVNVSCPNISNMHHLQDKDELKKILSQLIVCRENQKKYKPILLKISPDLNTYQIDDTIAIIEELGIDGLVVTNTTVRRDNLMTDVSTIKAIGNGGLSGRPLTQRSTEMIRYISQKTNHRIPIIGVGGIMSDKDAYEKMEAGASLVQIYTGFIYEGPFLVKRINRRLQ